MRIETETTHGIGMVLILVGGAISYGLNNHPIMHYTTILFLLIFIGLWLVNKAFNDAKRGKHDE